MAAITTIIAAAGVAAGAVGTAVQMDAQADAAKASKRAEKARQAQAGLEAERQRRSVVRQAQQARAMAVASATSQGAQYGSGLQGGIAQVQNQAANNMFNVNASEGLGNNIFAANRQLANAQARGAMGQGISSIGGSIYGARDELGKLYENYI